MSEAAHLSPCSKVLTQLPIACSTSGTLASDGKLPGNEASISTSWVKAAVLLQRNYKLSLVPRLIPESQEGTFFSSSSLLDDFSDR